MTNGKDSSLSVAKQRRLDEITESFQRALENGDAPDLESFARTADFPHFDQLIQSLVRIDIEHRVAHGMPVVVVDNQSLDMQTAEFAVELISDARIRENTISFNEPGESTGFEAGLDSMSPSLSGAAIAVEVVDGFQFDRRTWGLSNRS